MFDGRPEGLPRHGCHQQLMPQPGAGGWLLHCAVRGAFNLAGVGVVGGGQTCKKWWAAATGDVCQLMQPPAAFIIIKIGWEV
jgi:hypothetical protein